MSLRLFCLLDDLWTAHSAKRNSTPLPLSSLEAEVAHEVSAEDWKEASPEKAQTGGLRSPEEEERRFSEALGIERPFVFWSSYFDFLRATNQHCLLLPLRTALQFVLAK